MFPNKINLVIANLSISEIVDFHRSGDTVYNIGNNFILKVSQNIAQLQKEYKKDQWISQYISSPKPIMFVIEDGTAYYLRERLQGDVLCEKHYLNRPTTLVQLLADALKQLHSEKVYVPQYQLDEGYSTLVHGDFCLPNILAKDDKVVGYIDLGDCGIGDPWRDYAWCIWSLEYNLKTKDYTPLLLEKLGIQFDEQKFKKYTE